MTFRIPAFEASHKPLHKIRVNDATQNILL